MGITRLVIIYANKEKSISKTITDLTEYVENLDKTNKGELVTGYQCVPWMADVQFFLAKKQYTAVTNRSQGAKDVLANLIKPL